MRQKDYCCTKIAWIHTASSAVIETNLRSAILKRHSRTIEMWALNVLSLTESVLPEGIYLNVYMYFVWSMGFAGDVPAVDQGCLQELIDT